MNNAVTLKDVALLAGVSYQTVSKVIHQSIQVKADTAKRVWQAIDELGYVPNETARNLRLTKVSAIGYTWQPHAKNAFNPILEKFLQGMMSAASEGGYQIFCFPTTGVIEDDLQVYEKLFFSKKVGGFILSNIVTDDARIPFLLEHDIPFVCFGDPHIDGVDFIEVDGRTGMTEVVNHLVKQGHHKIALLAWEGPSRVGFERYQGYIDGIHDNGLILHNEMITYGTGSVESGFELTSEVLKRAFPTAVMAMNDLMAIGAMHAIKESGYEPGLDIAVCGFDDFPLIEYLRPSLTTVRQPAFLVGEMAVRFLIKKVTHSIAKQQTLILQPEVIIRESSSQIFQN